MSKTQEATVKEWLSVIHIACDPDSPFAGMVDLSEIFNLPLDVQHAIHAELTPVQLDFMKKLYGPKENT